MTVTADGVPYTGRYIMVSDMVDSGFAKYLQREKDDAASDGLHRQVSNSMCARIEEILTAA